MKKISNILFLYFFVFIMCMGASFAWYVWKGSEVSVDVNFADLDPYIKYTPLTIKSSDKNKTLTESNSYTGGICYNLEFNKKENGDNLDAYGQNYLKVTSATDSDIFKASNLKWTLVSVTNNIREEISTGNFVGENVVEGNDTSKMIPVSIDFSLTKESDNTSYEFCLWLDGNSYQNIDISGKNITVSMVSEASTIKDIDEMYIRSIEYEVGVIKNFTAYSSKYDITGYKIINTETTPSYSDSDWITISSNEDATIESGKVVTLKPNKAMATINNICIKNSNNEVYCKSIGKYNDEAGYKPSATLCNTLTYNGSSQQLVSSTSGTGYTLKNYTGTNAGDYTITASLKDNYVWKDGTNDNVTFKCSIDKKNASITASDQTIDYGNSIDSSVSKVTASGLVIGHTVSSITLTPSTSNVTTSGTITPSKATIVSGSTDVTSNYNITYKTGKLTITVLSIENATISLNPTSYTYDGTAKKPTVTVVLNDKTLVLNTDYSVSYSNNTDAGTAIVTVTGKGNYTGTKSVNFTINKKANTLTVSSKTLTYNKTAQALVSASNAQGTVYYALGTELTSSNYSSSGSTTIPTKTDVGSYTVYYYTPGNGNYQAKSGSVTSKINAYNLSNATIASVSSQTYTGSAITPTPAVTVPLPSGSTTTLTNNTDFTYSYANNTNAGTATVTVTGKGNYTGTKSTDFTISYKTYTITLDNQSATDIGTSKLYGRYKDGVYLDSAYSRKMTTTTNNITLPKKTGYTFEGYYTGDDGNGTQLINENGYITSAFIDSLYNSDVTLYAKWKSMQYIIKFNANGGTGTMSNQMVYYDESTILNVNKFTKSGYNFLGWSEDGSTKVILSDTTEYSSGSTSTGYTDFKEYGIDSPFYEGDQYRLEVDAKGSGTLYNYFYGYDGYLQVAKVVNSDGYNGTGTDGSNTISLKSEYTHYTVTFTLGSNGDGNVKKRLLFRTFSGTTAYVKNVKFYKLSSNLSDTTEYSGSTPTGVSYYTDFKEYEIDSPFYEGDQYRLEVDVKGSGTLYNYFYGYDGYLQVAKVVNSDGYNGTGTDGSNTISLKSEYTHYTVTFTLGSNGDGNVKKRLLFRTMAGTTAYIKNVKFYKIGDNETYQDGDTIKNSTSSAEKRLYALWGKNTYTVTFNSNNLITGLYDVGTTTSARMKYSVNNKVVTVTANDDDGYGFINARVYLDANTTYYFSCNTDGTWGSGGGNDDVEAFLMLNGEYNTYYGIPSNNYEFTPNVSGTYWLRLDVNASGKTHTFSNISISKKISTKTVTYNSQYGTLPTPTRAGHTFTGWYTKENGGTSISSSDIVSDASNHTLYASWSANNYTLDLNGWLNGSSSGDISGFGTADVYVNGSLVCNDCTDYCVDHPYGSIYEITDIKATTGHTYNGVYSGSLSGTLEDTTRTFLNFTSNNYTINYDNNGGSGCGSKTVMYNTSLGTLCTPMRSGYTFVGWYTANYKDSPLNYYSDNNSDLNSVYGYDAYSLYSHYVNYGKNEGRRVAEYISSDTYTTAGNITIYAGWLANKYTISYDNNGGSGCGSKTVIYNSSLGTLCTPTRVGYTFVGWYTANYKDSPLNYYSDNNSDLNSVYGYDAYSLYSHYVNYGKNEGRRVAEYISSDTYTTSDNITIYAGWLANKYTISYNANGGSNAPDSTIYIYNPSGSTNLSSSIPTRSGYNFLGWSTSSSGSPSYSAGGGFPRSTAGNTTLYAVWGLPTGINDYRGTISGKYEAGTMDFLYITTCDGSNSGYCNFTAKNADATNGSILRGDLSSGVTPEDAIATTSGSTTCNSTSCTVYVFTQSGLTDRTASANQIVGVLYAHRISTTYPVYKTSSVSGNYRKVYFSYDTGANIIQNFTLSYYAYGAGTIQSITYQGTWYFGWTFKTYVV